MGDRYRTAVTSPALVVGAIIVDDLHQPRRLLAARRSRPPALAGQWEFPGGKVEPGETAEAALDRELAEELAVTVRRGQELTAADGGPWPLTDGLVMRTWWCVLAGGDPVAGEAHDELRWVGAGTVLDLPWLGPDEPIVAAVRRRLRGHGPQTPESTAHE
ncbi:MAG: mismatch repair protein MutT [Friedmanniella sp.]|nr:mismatch repair protein MutT [Friedmanniella sp.]